MESFKYIGSFKDLKSKDFEQGADKAYIPKKCYGRKMERSNHCKLKIDDDSNITFILIVEENKNILLRVIMEVDNSSGIKMHSYFDWKNKDIIEPYIQDLIEENLVEEMDV